MVSVSWKRSPSAGSVAARAGATLLCLALVASACAESRFTVAEDSRVPRWFTLAAGTTRAQVSVELAYYVMPWGRSATLKLFDANGRTLKTVSAKVPGLAPIELDKRVELPVYEVLQADGITEVMEHRHPGPVVYVVDDPLIRDAVLKQVLR